MQRTNRKMRALIRESPEDNDGVILKSRVILTPTSANFYEDRSKSHNHKFLQIREAFDSLDFREVEKLANSNARSAPYSPQSRH
jgi:mevalonate pyrophosphate decarboxylase